MKARLFFAPDAAEPAGGSSPAPAALSASSSPTGMDIPVAGKTPPKAPEIVQPAPVVKQKGVVDVKKVLGLDKKPSQILSKQAEEQQKRLTPKNTIPVPPLRPKKEAYEAQSAPNPGEEGTKPEETPSEEQQNPSEKPKETTPAPVKLKIGDKEMTEAEIQAHIAELQKKAEAQKTPEIPNPAPEAKKEPQKTPEQVQAEEKAKNDKWLDEHADANGFTQEQFDKIIADGDVKSFNRTLAQRDLNQRLWFEKAVNPILEDLHARVQPVLEMHQNIQSYQDEATFFGREGNAELKPHLKLVRNIRNLMQEKYPDEWSKMSPEERDKETSANVRNFIRENNIPLVPVQAAAPAASPNAVPPQPAAPKPKPAPPTGNLGGGVTPRVVSEERGLIGRIAKRENIKL